MGSKAMTDQKSIDVTAEFEKMRAELLLIRVVLGLNPIHDPVTCVRELFTNGRDAFEKLRAPACDYAWQWSPRR